MLLPSVHGNNFKRKGNAAFLNLFISGRLKMVEFFCFTNSNFYLSLSYITTTQFLDLACDHFLSS